MSGKRVANRSRRKLRELKIKWNPERKVYEPVLLEEHVLKEIVERLWFQAKIRMVRINQPVGGKVRQNESGIPDLVGELPKRPLVVSCSRDGCGSTTVELPPTPLYIEVKRPGGARRTAQIRFIDEKKSAGCAAFFAESWMDVIRELFAFGIKLSA